MGDAPVQITPYSAAWPGKFVEQQDQLETILQPWLSEPVEHVGSTAVPGLAAKPIIDIAAPIRSLTEARYAIPVLERAGWMYWPSDPNSSWRLWFLRPQPENRTHHLYLIQHDDPHLQELTAFRDRLRRDALARDSYARFKQQLAQQYRADREGYTKAKSRFVAELLQQSGIEMQPRPEVGQPERGIRGKRDDRARSVRIRPWRPGDETAVTSLLDASADAVWRNQFHVLHGPDRDGFQWRRSRVATDRADTVIGAATVITNPLHAGRMPCAIEVAQPWRRRGVGSILLEQMRALRPDTSRPLSTKLRPDAPATAFVAQAGGRVYQRCTGVVVDPSHPIVRQWAAAQPKVTCTDLAALDTNTLVTAFADLYAWTHRNWSPVTNTNELMQASRQEIADVDRALSSGAWVDGQLAALALAFPTEGGFEVVAETIHPRCPRGQGLVAAALATVLEALASHGGGRVYIDGHLTDPHLQPVLDLIPQAGAKPVDLIEIG